MHIMHYKSDNDLTQWMPAEIFLMGGGGRGRRASPEKAPDMEKKVPKGLHMVKKAPIRRKA